MSGTTCYDPAGKTSKDYTPCATAGKDGFHTCCGTDSLCLPNGMCTYAGSNTKQQGQASRGLCTDQTFKSSSCPQFCLNGDFSQNKNLIKNCGNGFGCCLTGSDCSCTLGASGALILREDTILPFTAMPTAPFTAVVSGIAASLVTPTPVSSVTSATSSSSTQTSSGSRTSSSSSTTDSTPSSASSSSITSSTSSVSSSTPAIAAATSASPDFTASPPGISDLGIKIGAPVGVVVVLAGLVLAFFLFRRHSRRESISQNPALLPKKTYAQGWRPVNESISAFSTASTIPLASNTNKAAQERTVWDYQKTTIPAPTYYEGKESVVQPSPYPEEKIFHAPQEMYELPGRATPVNNRHELG